MRSALSAWPMVIFLLVLQLLPAGCGAQTKGDGSIKAEKRTLPPFTELDAGGAYQIDIVCQKPQSLEISADSNLLSLIRTEVTNGRLDIGSDSISPSTTPKVTISVPDLRRLRLSGASKVSIEGVKNEAFTVDASGAVAVKASGQTRSLTVTLSGAGQVAMGDLHSEKARIESSGAGAVDVWASESLSVHLSGVGAVTYAGNPKTVQKEISGLGTLRQK
ncbi:MAG: DUF2807 domain-containing protein [Candidatus Riflebacteria bacterium]|nr:DUF2807 domain-containing protein [Candidatus Riflebacteria bacterium]